MPTSVAEFCDIDTPFLPKNGGEFATGSPSLGSSILTTSAPSAAKKGSFVGLIEIWLNQAPLFREVPFHRWGH